MARSTWFILILAFAGFCGCLGARPVSARTTDGTLNVALRVVKSCDFYVGRMDFGNVGWLTPTMDQTTPVNITCTPNTPFTVSLDAGQNFAGGSRQMKRISGLWPPSFPYVIYKDSARTNAWGVNEAVAGNSGPTGKAAMQLYGRVTGLSLSLGSYSDTVVVTFAF